MPHGFSGRHFAVLVFALLLGLPFSSADAIERLSRDHYELAAGEVVESELWLTAGSATFSGTTRDDIYVYAARVNLTGTFEQDVWACGGTSLVFSGSAENQVRLAGRHVRIEGEFQRSVIALGESVALADSARLHGSAVLIGDTVTTAGDLQGDVWIYANTATIQGSIHGDLTITAGDIVISPGTVIDGDILYASAQELLPGSKVEVGGDVIRKDVPAIGLSYSAYLAWQAMLLGSTVILAIPFLRWFPATAGVSVVMLRSAPVRCLLTGLVIVWIVPLVAVAFLVIPWFFPAGLVMLAGILVLVFFSQITVAIFVGSTLLRQSGAQSFRRVIIALLIGLLVLYILTSAPIVNTAVWLLVATIGSGALVWGCIAAQQPFRSTALPTGAGPPNAEPPPVTDTGNPAGKQKDKE